MGWFSFSRDPIHTTPNGPDPSETHHNHIHATRSSMHTPFTTASNNPHNTTNNTHSNNNIINNNSSSKNNSSSSNSNNNNNNNNNNTTNLSSTTSPAVSDDPFSHDSFRAFFARYPVPPVHPLLGRVHVEVLATMSHLVRKRPQLLHRGFDSMYASPVLGQDKMDQEGVNQGRGIQGRRHNSTQHAADKERKDSDVVISHGERAQGEPDRQGGKSRWTYSWRKWFHRGPSSSSTSSQLPPTPLHSSTASANCTSSTDLPRPMNNHHLQLDIHSSSCSSSEDDIISTRQESQSILPYRRSALKSGPSDTFNDTALDKKYHLPPPPDLRTMDKNVFLIRSQAEQIHQLITTCPYFQNPKIQQEIHKDLDMGSTPDTSAYSGAYASIPATGTGTSTGTGTDTSTDTGIPTVTPTHPFPSPDSESIHDLVYQAAHSALSVSRAFQRYHQQQHDRINHIFHLLFPPDDGTWRSRLFHRTKEIREARNRANVDKIVAQGASIATKYDLLWRQQYKRRETLQKVADTAVRWKTTFEAVTSWGHVYTNYDRSHTNHNTQNPDLPHLTQALQQSQVPSSDSHGTITNNYTNSIPTSTSTSTPTRPPTPTGTLGSGLSGALIKFVQTMNDPKGPFREVRDRYGPRIISLTLLINDAHLLCNATVGALEEHHHHIVQYTNKNNNNNNNNNNSEYEKHYPAYHPYSLPQDIKQACVVLRDAMVVTQQEAHTYMTFMSNMMQAAPFYAALERMAREASGNHSKTLSSISNSTTSTHAFDTDAYLETDHR